MGEVLAELDRPAASASVAVEPPPAHVIAPRPARRPPIALLGRAQAVSLVAAGALFMLTQAKRTPTASDVDAARAATGSALCAVSCSWLTPTSVTAAPRRIGIEVEGV